MRSMCFNRNAQCQLELSAGCTDGEQCASGVCNTLAESPVCAATIGCGNGVLDSAEVCDDGNRIGGDGCDDSCGLENSWFGGDGCAVSTSSKSGGPGWLFALLIAMLVRHRREDSTEVGGE